MPLLMNITKGHYLTIRASSACRSSGDTFLLIGPKGTPLTPRPFGDTFFTNRPEGPPLTPRPSGDTFFTNRP